MHELFLIAPIENDALEQTLKILQGYCVMKPIPTIHRRMFFKGPLSNTKPIDPAFIARQDSEKGPLWKSLSEVLARQAYYVTLLYEMEKNEFPKAGSQDEAT
jgi:hypothetical protein